MPEGNQAALLHAQGAPEVRGVAGVADGRQRLQELLLRQGHLSHPVDHPPGTDHASELPLQLLPEGARCVACAGHRRSRSRPAAARGQFGPVSLRVLRLCILLPLQLDCFHGLAVDGVEADALPLLAAEVGEEPALVAAKLALIAEVEEALLVKLIALILVELVEGVHHRAVALDHARTQLMQVSVDVGVELEQRQAAVALTLDRVPGGLRFAVNALGLKETLEGFEGDYLFCVFRLQLLLPSTNQRAMLADEAALELFKALLA
mmetsp:Transcript_31259/g.97348  ORF Transcript_31259/g.97348 Transcript_31259/m.97348 type:complete len:264 (-) Transcript_31259:1124-1915(-)